MAPPLRRVLRIDTQRWPQTGGTELKTIAAILDGGRATASSAAALSASTARQCGAAQAALFARLLANDLARRGRPIPNAVREAALVDLTWALQVAWIERRMTLGPRRWPWAVEVAGMLDALAPG